MKQLEKYINEIIGLKEVKDELLFPNAEAFKIYDTQLQIAAKNRDLISLRNLTDNPPKDIRYKKVTIYLDVNEDSITLNKIVPTSFKGRKENIRVEEEIPEINLEY